MQFQEINNIVAASFIIRDNCNDIYLEVDYDEIKELLLNDILETLREFGYEIQKLCIYR